MLWWIWVAANNRIAVDLQHTERAVRRRRHTARLRCCCVELEPRFIDWPGWTSQHFCKLSLLVLSKRSGQVATAVDAFLLIFYIFIPPNGAIKTAELDADQGVGKVIFQIDGFGRGISKSNLSSENSPAQNIRLLDFHSALIHFQRRISHALCTIFKIPGRLLAWFQSLFSGCYTVENSSWWRNCA